MLPGHGPIVGFSPAKANARAIYGFSSIDFANPIASAVLVSENSSRGVNHHLVWVIIRGCHLYWS
jgi:hypothetical protein